MSYDSPIKFYKTLEQTLLSDDIDIKAQLCTELLEYCIENDVFDQEGINPLYHIIYYHAPSF